ncbi:hypothetical protein SDC9_130012 [bioreactor metagenome]|uniref:Uncharacterized protein n=1 Tax=bioreactor metagenome TaxID=1076179 RepID=A0A645D0C6_9ZZZZ
MHQQFAVKLLIAQPKERNAARLVDFLNERTGKVVISTNALNEHVLAGLYGAGKVDEAFRQLENSLVKHDSFLLFRSKDNLLYCFG